MSCAAALSCYPLLLLRLSPHRSSCPVLLLCLGLVRCCSASSLSYAAALHRHHALLLHHPMLLLRLGLLVLHCCSVPASCATAPHRVLCYCSASRLMCCSSSSSCATAPLPVVLPRHHVMLLHHLLLLLYLLILFLLLVLLICHLIFVIPLLQCSLLLFLHVVLPPRTALLMHNADSLRVNLPVNQNEV